MSNKESLKSKIYDRVETLRFTSKKGAEFIKAQLLKEIKREVPIELIYEIISEVKDRINNADEHIKKVKTAQIDLSKTKDLEKKDGGLKKFVKETEDERKFEFNYDADTYLYKTKDGKIYPVVRSTVCAMRNDFSSAPGGLNLTQNEIMMKYQLTSEAWIMIKTQTPMYKSSPIKDPISIEMILSKDDKTIKEGIDMDVLAAQEAKYRQLVDKSDRLLKERELKKFLDEDELNKRFNERLLDAIKKFNPKDFSDIVPTHIKNNDQISVVLADIHLGKIGTDGIVTRMGKVTRYMLDRPEKYINIKSIGDIFECVVINSEMHPGQKLGMETMRTADTIMLAVKLFEEMLYKLYEAGKIVTIDSIPGNHDRFTQREEDDPEKVPSELVFRFLQELLRKTNIKINIHQDRTVIIDEGNIRYAINHGYKFSKAELDRIVLQHSVPGKYLVILTGDKHFFTTEINDKVTRIQTRALAGPGKYDKGLNLTSLAGIVSIKENEDGLIDSENKTFR